MLQMVGLKRQYDNIKDEIDYEISQVLANTQFINGPNVKALERDIANYHGVKHAVGCANGTDALVIALEACGIGKNDEVITTPFTFIATAEAIAQVGAIPVFVDIEPITYNIDVTEIEEKITSRTKAILPVHLFGHPADMYYIMELARYYNLYVIEDCAQAFGATLDGKKVGTFGDIGCFSFFPSKNLACYGDGGMMITNDDVIHSNIKLLCNHGSNKKYHHDYIGHNSRLDEIQAAILNVKLSYIDYFNHKRRLNANIYKDNLSYSVLCPVERYLNKHVYHQFTIQSDKRDKIQNRLASHNIASMIYYPVPLHKQRVFDYLNIKYDLQYSEMMSKHVLSLPMFPEMTKQEILKVCSIVNGV